MQPEGVANDSWTRASLRLGEGEGETELRRRGTFFIKNPGEGESGLIISSVFPISRFSLLKRVSQHPFKHHFLPY